MTDLFPKFGRVVIVDDKYEEVNQVLEILAKNGIPYIFYDYNKMQDMDLVKIDGIRLMFLDIRLEEGTFDETTILSVLSSAIDRIVPPNNGPYTVVLWTNEFGMKDKVINYLGKNLLDGETTKPSFIVAIDKKEFMSEPSDVLAESIKKYYEDNNMLSFLTEIENGLMGIPSGVVSKITDDIINGINNSELEKLFLCLAMAEKGNCDSTENATKTILRQMSDLIRDKYMEIIADKEMVKELADLWEFNFSDEEKKQQIKNNFLAEKAAVINTALNVNTYSGREDNVPGKVYKHTQSTLAIDEDILNKYTFKNPLKLKCESHDFECLLDPIEIDITSSCDYAQGKNHLLRTAYGYILYIRNCTEEKHSMWINKKFKDKMQDQLLENVYLSPLFMINDELCAMIINTKCVGLKKRDFADSLEYMFRLNGEITNEIRKRAGEEISRLGINSV